MVERRNFMGLSAEKGGGSERRAAFKASGDRAGAVVERFFGGRLGVRDVGGVALEFVHHLVDDMGVRRVVRVEFREIVVIEDAVRLRDDGASIFMGHVVH
ncbi:MAG: hypothetical protein KDJ44_02835 [Rhodoblastus sp.]|nr:hypothetical protein [Rhodoblastus sp.]MCC0004701.1 hypothetical protein [Methylobacteriaceae bacterium]